MEKKIKDSIKQELIKQIKKDIAKNIVKEVFTENLIQELKDEVLNHFFEDKITIGNDWLELKKEFSEFCNKMDNSKLDKIKDGKLKKFFNVLLKEKHLSCFNNIKDELTDFQIANDPLTECMFINGVEKKDPKIKIYNHVLNKDKFNDILSRVNDKLHDEYHLIEFTVGTLQKLFDMIDEYKNELSVISETKNTDDGERKVYTVTNKVDKFHNDNGEINKKHLSFDLEVGFLSEHSQIELKNLNIDGVFIAHGILEIKKAKELLEIVMDIEQVDTKEQSMKKNSVKKAGQRTIIRNKPPKKQLS